MPFRDVGARRIYLPPPSSPRENWLICPKIRSFRFLPVWRFSALGSTMTRPRCIYVWDKVVLIWGGGRFRRCFQWFTNWARGCTYLNALWVPTPKNQFWIVFHAQIHGLFKIMFYLKTFSLIIWRDTLFPLKFLKINWCEGCFLSVLTSRDDALEQKWVF